jgi:hypothetical protein
MTAQDEHVKGGAANHGSHTDLDAPTPPGGPQRQDRPAADVRPTASVDPGPSGPDPQVRPSSNPDGPATIPAPGTPPGEPGPDPEPQPDDDPDAPAGSDFLQEENARTSLDQPSDGSGSE